MFAPEYSNPPTPILVSTATAAALPNGSAREAAAKAVAPLPPNPFLPKKLYKSASLSNISTGVSMVVTTLLNKRALLAGGDDAHASRILFFDPIGPNFRNIAGSRAFTVVASERAYFQRDLDLASSETDILLEFVQVAITLTKVAAFRSSDDPKMVSAVTDEVQRSLFTGIMAIYKYYSKLLCPQFRPVHADDGSSGRISWVSADSSKDLLRGGKLEFAEMAGLAGLGIGDELSPPPLSFGHQLMNLATKLLHCALNNGGAPQYFGDGSSLYVANKSAAPKKKVDKRSKKKISILPMFAAMVEDDELEAYGMEPSSRRVVRPVGAAAAGGGVKSSSSSTSLSTMNDGLGKPPARSQSSSSLGKRRQEEIRTSSLAPPNPAASTPGKAAATTSAAKGVYRAPSTFAPPTNHKTVEASLAIISSIASGSNTRRTPRRAATSSSPIVSFDELEEQNRLPRELSFRVTDSEYRSLYRAGPKDQDVMNSVLERFRGLHFFERLHPHHKIEKSAALRSQTFELPPDALRHQPLLPENADYLTEPDMKRRYVMRTAIGWPPECIAIVDLIANYERVTPIMRIARKKKLTEDEEKADAASTDEWFNREMKSADKNRRKYLRALRKLQTKYNELPISAPTPTPSGGGSSSSSSDSSSRSSSSSSSDSGSDSYNDEEEEQTTPPAGIKTEATPAAACTSSYSSSVTFLPPSQENQQDKKSPMWKMEQACLSSLTYTSNHMHSMSSPSCPTTYFPPSPPPLGTPLPLESFVPPPKPLPICGFNDDDSSSSNTTNNEVHTASARISLHTSSPSEIYTATPSLVSVEPVFVTPSRPPPSLETKKPSPQSSYAPTAVNNTTTRKPVYFKAPYKKQPLPQLTEKKAPCCS